MPCGIIEYDSLVSELKLLGESEELLLTKDSAGVLTIKRISRDENGRGTATVGFSLVLDSIENATFDLLGMAVRTTREKVDQLFDRG